MVAALTVAGLFISLAWGQQLFLDRLLQADLQQFRQSSPRLPRR